MGQKKIISHSTGITALLLATILILTFLMRLPFHDVPLIRDEGEYAYIGQRMLDGDIPYRDIFIHKPPMAFYIYLVALPIFGQTGTSIHLFATLYIMAAILALYWMTRSIYDQKTALVSSVVFSIITFCHNGLIHQASTEIFMLFPMIIGFHALVYGINKKKLFYIYLSGLLCGVAFMTKQTGLYYLIFALFAITVFQLRRKQDRKLAPLIRNFICLLAGFLTLIGAILLHLGLNGALKDFFDQVFVFNYHYVTLRYNPGFVKTITRTLTKIFRGDQFLWLTGIVTFGYFLIRDRTPANLSLAVWFILLFAGACSGGGFYGHYFLPVIPAISIAAGYGLTKLVSECATSDNKLIDTGIALVVIALCIIPVFVSVAPYFKISPEKLSRNMVGMNPFLEAKVVARYISESTTEKDSIFVIGSEPEIYFLSNRRSASKYIFFYSLTTPYPGVLKDQKKVVAEIRRNQPKYVVLVQIPTSFAISPSSELYVFKALKRLIASDYILDGVVVPKNNPLAEYHFAYQGKKKIPNDISLRDGSLLIYRLRDI